MITFDPGPPPEFAQLFAQAPDYGPFKQHFWYDWGPVFYRGRLDGSAPLLCIASDPGPTERIALRTLVGDAGQRVQGFVTKLGLTRSYLCLNAFIYALFPSHAASAPQILSDPCRKAGATNSTRKLKDRTYKRLLLSEPMHRWQSINGMAKEIPLY